MAGRLSFLRRPTPNLLNPFCIKNTSRARSTWWKTWSYPRWNHSIQRRWNWYSKSRDNMDYVKPMTGTWYLSYSSSALTSSPVNLRCERRCCTKSLKSIVLCLWYICCKGSAKRAKYKIKNKFCFHFNGLWGYSSKSHRRASDSTAGSESHNNFGILSLMTSNDGSLYSFFLLVIVVYLLMYFFPFLIYAPLLGLPLSERPLRS